MDTRKRSGRHKRLETIRGERRKQKQRQHLATLLIVGGGVLLVVAVIVIIALGGNKTPSNTSTPIPITPISRPQANGLAMGNPEAPVRIDVWEDFQCPMCVQYTDNVERKLIDSYIVNGIVYYIFHQYPFIDKNVGGKESKQSANASMCANEQDRFWDYHDIVYANWNGEGEGAFSDKRLTTFAETLGLDMVAFNSCFKANRYQDQIDKDYQAGVSVGVSGTPSVFVNNKEVTPGYVPSYEQMVQAIQEALTGK
jgi:protein-disulfide isomerase